MVWDTGTWEPEQEDVEGALKKGDLKFTLHGKKLRGSWVLVRTRGFGSSSGKTSWLLIKHRDAHASTEDVTIEEPQSAVSGRLLAEIAEAGGGDVAKAATGDPRAAESAAVKGRAKKKKAAGGNEGRG
jgi:bifunctional non-homologous end joining protein LigD